MLLAALCATPLASAETASKNTIEAAFLYKFALFTLWPDMATGDTFNICVLGDNPFGTALEQLNGKLIQNQPVRTRIAHSTTDAGNCQVLFVPASGHTSMHNMADALKGSPILIVSEANGYDPHDVMIMLGEQDGRINFQINHSATQRAGLDVSSRLLRLANRVY